MAISQLLRLTMAAALTGGLSGCGTPTNKPDFRVPRAESGQLARLRGHLTFIRCGGPPDTLWIADTPDHQVEQALGALGNGPLTAVVRLDGGVVTAVRYVAPEGPTCDRLPAAADFTAQGNEPFWHLAIAGDSAVVTTPDRMNGIRFRAGSWTRARDGGWRYTAFGTEHGDTITASIAETRCIDSMSGAWFPYRVEVAWGDRRVTGCGLEGKGAMRPPA